MMIAAVMTTGCAPMPRGEGTAPASMPERVRGVERSQSQPRGGFDPFYGEAEVAAPSSQARSQASRPQTAAVSSEAEIEARALLARLRSHTGLNSLQQARVDHVSRLIDERRIADALRIGRILEDDFETVYRPYQARAGETLWSIAAREDVYANAELWPLIWRANQDRVPRPEDLSTGTILRIRSHPTVGNVVEALNESRGLGGELRIGPIREAPH
jgi:nucleoid-associated protein YgaU